MAEHTQAVTAVCPVFVVFVFDGQAVHEALPMDCLYVPTVHAVQISPSRPENPRLHLQSVIAIDPTTDCELEVQFWHMLAPMVLEYVLMPQSVHTDAPVAEYLPAPQSMHVAAKDLPIAAEYLPAPQSVQLAALVAVVYLPATQAVHALPV